MCNPTLSNRNIQTSCNVHALHLQASTTKNLLKTLTDLLPSQNLSLQNSHHPRPRALPDRHPRRLPHHLLLPRHPPRLKQVLPLQLLERPPPHSLPLPPTHHHSDRHPQLRRPLLRRRKRTVAHHENAASYYGSCVGE